MVAVAATVEGLLGMRIGPISANHSGTMVLDERDAATRIDYLIGSGTDKKGAGSAQAKIVATLESSSSTTTTMAVNSDVRLTGRVASLGRGVQDGAGKIVEQFAHNLGEELTAPEPPPSAEGQNSVGDAGQEASRSLGSAPRTRGERNQPNQLKVLPLLWSLLKDKITALANRVRKRFTQTQRGTIK